MILSMRLINKSRIFIILFILCLCYLLYGIFPFAPYENDSLGIITGCKRMIETGIFSSNEFSYWFPFQPGTYFGIIMMHILSGINLLNCYSILSAFLGIGFLFLSMLFLQKITDFSFACCGLILLLFQETYSTWFYCNSAVIAGAVMMLAFNILIRRSTLLYLIISGLLLGAAVWTRLDVIISYPVIFFLLKSKNWKERIIRTIVLAFLTLVFGWFLFLLSNTSISELYSSLTAKHKVFTFAYNVGISGVLWSHAMRSYLGFFSILLILLIIIGIIVLIKNKCWQILAYSLTPVFFFIIIIKGNITAPKHLFYLIPFLAIPVISAFQYMDTLNRIFKIALKICAITFFLLQYVFGLQVFFKTHPYIGQNYATVTPYPTYLKILNFKINKVNIDSIKFVIGGGMKMSTADEMMLSSGIIFSPIMWHQLKLQCNQDIKGLENYIESYPNDTLRISTTQGSNDYVTFILSKMDFSLKINNESEAVWMKNKKTILVAYTFYPKEINKYCQLILSNKGKDFVFIPYYDWERYFIRNCRLNYTKINDITYKMSI